MTFIEKHQRLFANIPDEHHFPDPEYVLNADIEMANPSQPIKAKNQYEKTIKDTTSQTIREIVPILNHLCGEVEEKLLQKEINTELVIDQELLEVAKSTYPNKLESELENDNLKLYVCEKPIKFGLAVTNTMGYLTVYSQKGLLMGYLSSDDSDFIDWCNNLYDEYRTLSLCFSE